MQTTDLGLLNDGAATLDPETFAPFGVRGPDKVAQRFLYALFTPFGSIPGRPREGTHFLEMISGFGSDYDLHAAFSACSPRATSTVRSWESDTDPDSDRLAAVRLNSLEFTAGLLTLVFEILTRDRSKPSQTIDYVLDV